MMTAMTGKVAPAPPMPSDLFALQLAFARRVVAVTVLSLSDALLQYTTCYSATGLRHPFTPDPDAPEWRDFLAGFLVTEDQAVYVHTAYLAHRKTEPERVSCFSYRYEKETRTVRMQFANKDPLGSLKQERMDARLAELRALIEGVRVDHPNATHVHGQSWLYNLPAYCRLFPPVFVSAPIPVPGEYTVLSSWGPFMDRHGGVKPDLATAFRTAIASAITLDALLTCFPYPILSVSCDIAHFYTHYGVVPPM